MLVSDMISPNKDLIITDDDLIVDYIVGESINSAFIRKIESMGMSMAEFSRMSGVSEKTLRRYKSGSAEPSLENLVTHCIALQTNVFDSLHLISRAGYNIIASDEKKIYLILIFMSRYMELDIHTANEVLKSMGMNPLNKI